MNRGLPVVGCDSKHWVPQSGIDESHTTRTNTALLSRQVGVVFRRRRHVLLMFYLELLKITKAVAVETPERELNRLLPWAYSQQELTMQRKVRTSRMHGQTIPQRGFMV